MYPDKCRCGYFNRSWLPQPWPFRLCRWHRVIFGINLTIRKYDSSSTERKGTCGTKMNLQKTKLMTNYSKSPKKIACEFIEDVDIYIYLGKQVSFNRNENLEDITRRINITWQNTGLTEK